MAELATYTAFLRGINVGGHKLVKMADLKKAFESLGLGQVRTLLASGNVLFKADNLDSTTLTCQIEEALKKTFGHEIRVVLCTIGEIEGLVDSNPFGGITVTPQSRLYVTFLSEKPQSSLTIPYESPGKDFQILRVSDNEVCSVLTLTPGSRTIDAMNILEKEFGKNITTRNWNTIERILKVSAT